MYYRRRQHTRATGEADSRLVFHAPLENDFVDTVGGLDASVTGGGTYSFKDGCFYKYGLLVAIWSVPPRLDVYGNYTVCLKLNYERLMGNGNFFGFSKNTSDIDQVIGMIGILINGRRFEIQSRTNSSSWLGGLTVGTYSYSGKWYSVVYTHQWTGTTLSRRFYIHGFFDAGTTYANSDEKANANLLTGIDKICLGMYAPYTGGGNYADGYFKDLKIYNEALPEEECLMLLN